MTFETPSHLASIPHQLFFGCTLLKNINLPDSVITTAGSAFAYSGITSLTVPGYTMSGSLFIHLGTIVRCFADPASIRIPGSVREIGDSAFSHLFSLVALSFEEGVERIGVRAFCDSSQIQGVDFPASLKVIAESACANCSWMREITFA
jgi:hypothetical protein